MTRENANKAGQKLIDNGLPEAPTLCKALTGNFCDDILKASICTLLLFTLKSFLDSVDRVASVSLDKKDGVKFNLTKDVLNLSVNNTNSGDGKESLNVKFDYDLDISFNSRYLIDVASQLDGDQIEIYFKDTGAPALIKDPADFDSIYVVMPMKG